MILFTDRTFSYAAHGYSDLGVDLTNRTWVTVSVQACYGAFIAFSPTPTFTGAPLKEFAYEWKYAFYASGYAFALA